VSKFLNLGPKEFVGDLGDDPGAVTSFGIGVHSSAVCQGAQRLEGVLEDLVGTFPVNLGDKPDPAGVVFMGGRIQGAEALCGVEKDLIHGSRVECGPRGWIAHFNKAAGRFKTFLWGVWWIIGQQKGGGRAKNGQKCAFLYRKPALLD
jgi:hypothetical protein